jgi:hypothetical protein
VIKYFFLFLFLFFISPVFSQEENDAPIQSVVDDDAPPAPKQYYVFSPRVSVTVPHPMGNGAFRKSFVGIYEFSGGLNINIFKGFFIGATYKNGLLKITENKIADFNASMTINNAAIKVGTDIFVGDRNRIIFSAAMSAGQNYTNYTGLVRKKPGETPEITSYSTSYFEPEVNLFFLIESNFGIGATLSYSIFNKEFNPHELGLSDWTNFNAENPGKTRYLSFGFGFYYSFLKKGKAKRG